MGATSNIKSYMKLYYDRNRLKNIAKYKKKTEDEKNNVICECGGHYKLWNKNIHMNSKKHMKYCNSVGQVSCQK